MSEAREKSPPSNWRMRSGRTGAMMPKASMSKPTMMRMKTKAARGGLVGGVGAAEEDKVGSREKQDCRLAQHAAPLQRGTSPNACWDALKCAPTTPQPQFRLR